ncbi:transketolase [bacterium C-53]|nr:transketolase [Lachnospiraceae bacterium]NBI02670.1 transketolase [Lachnospiraceae bacterium]RKJ11308.1 transketolase [bacterium C-53]
MIEVNEKNTKMWSNIGPRATYGLALLDLIEANSRVYALSADLGGSSGMTRLMSVYPDHYLNTGIAEQNLIGVSAGLAKEGLIPFASSFAPFITHRCADQIRMNMGYMHLNIKTVGLGSGVSMSILGNSHYGIDDMSFMRSIPGMTILSPCDCAELVMCVNAAAEYEGPVYIRMTGEPRMPRVYENGFEFQIGKANKLCSGEDVMIVATGSMVATSLDAARVLAQKGVETTVIDMHTIKPLDLSIFENIPVRCKLIVTVEEHSIIGGLGTAVAQYIASQDGLPKVLNIGLPDEYVKAGGYAYMLNMCNLTGDAIVHSILRKIEAGG